MKLSNYQKKYSNSLRKATLCLLVKDRKILLAMKKRGFGQGKLNGVGGKVKKGEDIKQAAIRETQEEINVIPTSQKPVAALNFYFVNNPNDNQQVIVFLIEKWQGEPRESEEMKPYWYQQNQIPFEKMWADDQYWLPQILKGKIIIGDFLFENDKLLEKQIKTVIPPGIEPEFTG